MYFYTNHSKTHNLRIFALQKLKKLESTHLLELATKYGSPLYVYDTDKISSQYNRLTTAFSGVKNLKLIYAVKALSNINILRFFKDLGAGLDTVSIQEVQLSLTTGIDPKKIIYKIGRAHV